LANLFIAYVSSTTRKSIPICSPKSSPTTQKYVAVANYDAANTDMGGALGMQKHFNWDPNRPIRI